MPTLDSEIELLEVFSKANVIAITLNHENMTDIELEKSIENYEFVYDLPATDVLKHGTEKLIQTLYKVFPELVHANYCNDISKIRN